jgi:hypothetical protein
MLVGTLGLAPSVVAQESTFVYDPRFHTFESWASLMVEMYAAQQLEIPTQGTDWREWGNGLVAISLFNNEGTPSPQVFEDWQDWAQALLTAINFR